MYRKLRLFGQLWRYMGPSWLLFRLKYAAQLRSGWLQHRMPAYPWSAHPLSTWLKAGIPSDADAYLAWRQWAGGRFFFDYLPRVPPNVPWNPHYVVEEADSLLAGTFRYFGHTDYYVGFPPDWHLNPMTGQRLPEKAHWTQISDFGQGDIKLVWEASRFGYVYTLARAYAASRDERYPAAFWQLVEDWVAKNPPNTGPNWKCGQEAAFRLMAWSFGLYAFAQSESTTPARVVSLAEMIAAHAERIAANIAYAYFTKSNHGISEAVGLWTIGLLFPEFAQAKTWLRTGKRYLEREIRRQIYADGSYVMPSINYYRMSLQACLWALRLGEINGQPLSSAAADLISKGIDFLYQLVDPDTGRLPNFGSNDGALILPLNTCDYTDYRPLLQLGHYAANRQHLFEPGPWNEDLFWLFGPEALDASLAESSVRQLRDFTAAQGGYYTLRGENSWSMIRCAHLTDRPSQVDQLHVDLWWRGFNIACDAGTYLYNRPDPWRNGLVSTSVHNTVTVDDQEQMTQAGHFTWVDWAQGRVRCQRRSAQGQIAYWEGEHTGYQRLVEPVLHRRGVLQLGAEHWLVIDRLESPVPHFYRLHWLLPEYPHSWDRVRGSVDLETSAGAYRVRLWSEMSGTQYTLVKADERSVEGWRSLYYADKQPALSLSAQAEGSTVTFISLFGPTIALDKANTHLVSLAALTWNGTVNLATGFSPQRLVKSISINGTYTDFLETST